MRSPFRIRLAGIALIAYGLIGIFVGVFLAVVGAVTLREITELRAALERERGTLATSLRTVAHTVGDSASATGDFERSLAGARDSAEAASRLAFDTAATFRGISQAMLVEIFGYQPFVGITPQFDQSALQIEELSATLGATARSLRQNGADVQRVGRDLVLVQRQVELLAATIDRVGLTGTPAVQRPYEIAFFGMCLLFTLQSLFSLIAGLAVLRAGATLGTLRELVIAHRAQTTTVPASLVPREVSVTRSERPPAAA